MWTTFNEPIVFCSLGYTFGIFPPGLKDMASGFKAGHTVIQAHTKAYRLYEADFKSTQKGSSNKQETRVMHAQHIDCQHFFLLGQCGIVLVSNWAEPRHPDDPNDVAAAERANQSHMGWFAEPIFGCGDYNDCLKEGVANMCKKLGMDNFLPQFTPEEIQLNKGSF